jgi:hypothetical protein
MTYHDCIKLATTGKIDDAIECYNRKLKISPTDSLLWRKTLLCLLKGDYSLWPKYEWTKGWYKPSSFPLWRGEETNKLLITHDQGIGDLFHFARYIKLINTEKVKQIVLEKYNLVMEWLGLPLCDLSGVTHQIPLMYLPAHFNIQEGNFSASNQYFKPSSTKKFMTDCIEFFPRPLIGVAWKGSSRHAEDLHRSIKNELVQEMLLPDLTYLTVQKETSHKNMVDTGLLLKDWEDTIALISELDLVISVDTAVAHLAAALGKKVWLLLSKFPDWRWGLEGETTAWYPSVKIYRQEVKGDWLSVLHKVKEDSCHITNDNCLLRRGIGS